MTAPVSRTLSLEEALLEAVAHHQAGRLQEAEQLYRAILQLQPNHPDANHNLGTVAMQRGQPGAGLPHLKMALDANPGYGQYWLSYIEALLQSGQNDVARQVLEEGRPRGLQGDEVEALAARLGVPAEGKRGLRGFPPEEKPGPQEIETLLETFNQGRYKEAAAQARKMAERFPGDEFSWKVLGVALKQLGRKEEALVAMQRALELLPEGAESHNNLGAVLKDLGRLEEAEASCRRALELKPDYAEAHYNLGITLEEMGRFVEALKSFESAIVLKPDYADACSRRSHVKLHLGEYQEGYRRDGSSPALAARSEQRLQEAVALHQAGKVHEAKEIYQSLMRQSPNSPDLLRLLGTAENQLGHVHEGLALLDRSAQLAPHHPETRNNLGNALLAAGRSEEALASYDHAIRLKQDYVEAYANRGNALWELGQLDRALASFGEGIRLKPNDTEAILHFGNLLGKAGRFAEALENIERAIRLTPDNTEAFWNKAHLKLRLGEYREGWQLFEKRWERQGKKANRHVMSFAVPIWLGESSLRGKTIFLYAEQGLGDTLQFCRYAKLVSALGAKVYLAVPSELVRLLRDLEGVDKMILDGEPLPEFDVYCPLMSLPLAFKTTVASIPAEIPYLKCDVEKSTYWKNRLGEKTRLRVGLAWSTGVHPNIPEHSKDDNARRDIPLAHLEALRSIRGVEYYSLQKGAGETQLRELVASSWSGPKIIDFTQELEDFSDTAALIENLDLVISVDTAAAHLAGALGKPVWIMARFDACWRWLLDRTDSPWYPTARLFRQASFNDWLNVVAEVKEGLEELVSQQARNFGQKDLPAAEKPAAQEIEALLETFNRGRHAEAVVQAREMTKRFPGHGFGWKVLGASLKQMGRSDEALAAMQRALELAPNDFHSHNNLGAVLKDLGRLDEAEASFRRAIGLRPDQADAHYNLGIVLKEMGRQEEAAVRFRKALGIRPDYAEALNNLGIVLHDMGRLGDAEASFLEVIRIRPDYAEAHNNLGITLQDSGRLQEAEASFRDAIGIRPEYAEAHNNLSIILQDSGRLEDAESGFRRALNIKPDYVEAQVNLGIILQGLGRLEEAETCFRQAIRVRPDDADAHSYLGRALMEIGKREEAEIFLHRAIDLAPGRVFPLATAL